MNAISPAPPPLPQKVRQRVRPTTAEHQEFVEKTRQSYHEIVCENTRLAARVWKSFWFGLGTGALIGALVVAAGRAF